MTNILLTISIKITKEIKKLKIVLQNIIKQIVDAIEKLVKIHVSIPLLQVFMKTKYKNIHEKIKQDIEIVVYKMERIFLYEYGYFLLESYENLTNDYQRKY